MTAFDNFGGFSGPGAPTPGPGAGRAPGAGSAPAAPAASATSTSVQAAQVAIIGWGTAGVNAAIGLRDAGYTGRVVAFSNTHIAPYSPILTSYYAGGQKTYEECFPWMAEQLALLNVDVVADAPVDKIDLGARQIHTPRGVYSYERCVIASGATPVPVGFPKDCGYAPLLLRTMDDAQRMKDAFESPACKRVLVSGASMVALKSLEAALCHGKQCTMVGMNPHVLDFNALPAAAERFERGLREKGVELRLGMTIQAVQPVSDPRGRLQVTFSNGDVDFFDDIAVAHGMKCNLDFLELGALAGNRALEVDEFMRTSDPRVYAAGDVAQALELTSGEKRIVGIWKNAAVQGEIAGAAIAAEMRGDAPDPAHAFKGSIPANTIAVNGTLFISAGSMQMPEGRTMEVREGADMTVVYLYDPLPDGGRKLVGYNLVCDTDEAGSVAYDTAAMLSLRIDRVFR